VRIAYGVHGYGRGHAVRALAVLAELSARHDVLVLAGRDALGLLAPHRAEPIPCLGFAYLGARLSAARTLRDNAGLLAELALGRGAVRAVEERLAAFRPDVVVSDSEPLVLRAAGRLGIPRIGLDHVGIIAWCRPAAPLADALRLERDAVIYRLLMGRPERAIVSSFFPAPPSHAGVFRVPPILRAQVLRASPSDAGHLLVYFNSQPLLLGPSVLEAVAGAGLPAVIYGADREGRDGPLTFRRIDPDRFVEDLAAARAVLSTAGHQLASEALHLGKPMLLCPEESAEQRLNARELVRLGAGRGARAETLDARTLRAFLGGLDAHREALARLPRQGNAPALALLEAVACSLAGAAPATAAPAGSVSGGVPDRPPAAWPGDRAAPSSITPFAPTSARR